MFSECFCWWLRCNASHFTPLCICIIALSFSSPHFPIVFPKAPRGFLLILSLKCHGENTFTSLSGLHQYSTHFNFTASKCNAIPIKTPVPNALVSHSRPNHTLIHGHGLERLSQALKYGKSARAPPLALGSCVPSCLRQLGQDKPPSPAVQDPMILNYYYIASRTP